MKNINLILLLFVLFLASCQKNQDVIETETEITSTSETAIIDFSWRSSVYDPESVMHLDRNSIVLHNVSVKIMSRGFIIAQTNTDENGTFVFDNVLVPSDAYVLFESPGYHNAVVKVSETMGWQLNMVRNTYPDITRETISTKEEFIDLTGYLQDGFRGRDLWYYITNDKNELVGTATRLGDLDHFKITTLPNEELFLHYGLRCFSGGVIPLGSFTEDKDLGAVLAQTQDFSIDFEHRLVFGDPNDCAGNEIFENDLYQKINGQTKGGNGNRVILFADCEISTDPILVTVTDNIARKYQELSITFPAGQMRVDTEINVCEDDDTYVHYTLGGVETQSDIFTFANILPDGRLVIKQPALDAFNNKSLSFVNKSATVGNSKGDVLFSFLFSIGQGGNDLDFNITKNDGEFVEGTVSGELYDTEEISQGNFEAIFRARIQ